jgi:DNA repair protein RadA/Sms
MRFSKSRNLPTFIVGHVTKEGSIAGPRLLEHMVDTVLYFEGNGNKSYRIVRAVKNRYGSTNEIGVFEMTDAGLKEVANPSALFLAERSKETCGSVAVATVEGTRVILVELQSLVNPSYLNMPRRLSSGVDYNRLALMVAVLERRVGLKLSQSDIYVSVAGGVKIVEPAADLAVALAVASARENKSIPNDLVAFGEIGLAGEVRGVSFLDQRLKEAAKLGFKKAVVPPQEVKTKAKMQVMPVSSVKEAVQRLKLKS